MFNGATIADTSSALYVWEHEFYPQFYLPMEAFVPAPGYEVSLTHGEPIFDDRGKTIIGGGLELAVRRRGGTSEEVHVLREMVLFAADLEGPAGPLSNYVKVVFGAVGTSLLPSGDLPHHAFVAVLGVYLTLTIMSPDIC